MSVKDLCWLRCSTPGSAVRRSDAYMVLCPEHLAIWITDKLPPSGTTVDGQWPWLQEESS